MGSLGKAYYDEKIIDIKTYLDEENLETLKKLGIEIEDKIYTAYEYEVFSGKVSSYYKEDDYSVEDLKFVKSLEGTGVTQEEYDNLIDNMSQMDEILYSRKY